MAKFINKKEQVYDLKLTSYGHYLLSSDRVHVYKCAKQTCGGSQKLIPFGVWESIGSDLKLQYEIDTKGRGMWIIASNDNIYKQIIARSYRTENHALWDNPLTTRCIDGKFVG